jgi:mRNA interferase MazF
MGRISLRRGEIWLVNLDPTIGAEISKTRTAVIISSDTIGKLPLKVIVPITGWQESFTGVPWMVRITPDSNNSLDKESAADTFQIRSVSQSRMVHRIGYLNNKTLEEIVQAIDVVISDI